MRSTRFTRARASIGVLLIPVLLVLGIAALLAVAPNLGLAARGRVTMSAHALHPNADPFVGRARSTNLPTTGNWQDSDNRTSYTAGLIPDADGYTSFSFTLPTGEQISNSLPLVAQKDGTYEQGTALTDSGKCQSGVLESDTPLDITYLFSARISADALAAYASFTFVSTSDVSAVSELCNFVTTGLTTYELIAGCTPSSCSDLASQTGPSIEAYDNEVVNAGTTGDWGTVWSLTSQQITAQYPEAAFTATLNQQSESVGKITSISAPVSAPQVEYTPEGQAYFAVDQTVTLVHNGSTTTESITSYYVMEGGAWLFWFSS